MSQGEWLDGSLIKIELTDTQKSEHYEVMDFNDAIHVGHIKSGIQSGYGEVYAKDNGFKYFEGKFQRGKPNGLCK